MIQLSKRLEFSLTNNGAKYEACLFTLSSLLTLGADEAEIIGDSNLVIRQVVGDWEVREASLYPYLKSIWAKASIFWKCEFHHVLREEDSLAILASRWENPKQQPVKQIIVEVTDTLYYLTSVALISTKQKWYSDIFQYLKNNTFPTEATNAGKTTL